MIFPFRWRVRFPLMILLQLDDQWLIQLVGWRREQTLVSQLLQLEPQVGQLMSG